MAIAAGGCARAQARGAAAGPPLNVPEPPPRVITPADEPLAAAPAIPDPPPVAALPPTPTARPPARRTNGTTTPEAEPKPPEPVPAAAVAPPPPEPPPPRELRAAPSARDAAADRAVRETLTRAARDLNRVDYGKLGAEGRTQYDQSKRFTQQAEQALKDRNFVFASTLADKAATLAAGLLGR